MPAQTKSCGPCGLCCKVFAVEELAKPMGAACPHYRGGCSIYGTRPRSCRSFECVWLMDPEMPHRFRPDQTRVVLDQDPEGLRLIARCDPANPLAWKRDPMHAALRARAASTWRTGRLVLAVAGRRTWVITPLADIDLGEIDPRSALRVEEGAGGEVKVAVTPPDAAGG